MTEVSLPLSKENKGNNAGNKKVRGLQEDLVSQTPAPRKKVAGLDTINAAAIAAARASKSPVPAPEVIPPGAMTRQEAWAAFGVDEGSNPADAAHHFQQLADEKGKPHLPNTDSHGKATSTFGNRPENHNGEPQHAESAEDAKEVEVRAAAEQVARLVQGERLAAVLGKDPATGAPIWERGLAKFPAYAERARELRTSLLRAWQRQREYPVGLPPALEVGFYAISDPKARELLADILVSRTYLTHGSIDDDVRDVEAETAAIVQELGVGGKEPGSWNEDLARTLTTQDVIAAVLQGRVHLRTA